MADLETFNFRTFSTDEQMRNDKRAPTLGGKGEIAMADKTADNTGDNAQKDPKDWVSGDDPMTGAQESYLKTLAEQAHKPLPKKDLTKAEASELIDTMRQKAGLEK
jgi:tRNA G37 N-methylase TrmD